MDGCGLIVRHDDTEYLPQVDAITSNGTVDTLRLRLAAGQSPQDVADAAEGLRHVYRALRCSVREDGPGWVLVRFFVRDPLTDPIPPAPLPPLPGAGVPAQRPTVDVVLAAVDDAPHDPPAVAAGRCRSVRRARPWTCCGPCSWGAARTARPWLLNLVATHVLVAGSHGGGEGLGAVVPGPAPDPAGAGRAGGAVGGRPEGRDGVPRRPTPVRPLRGHLATRR